MTKNYIKVKGMMQLDIYEEPKYPIASNDNWQTRLPPKYDIDYCIALCRIIEAKCQENQLGDQKAFRFSLQSSLQKLIAFLLVEKNNVNNNKRSVIHMTCAKCQNTELCFADSAKEWKCSICNP